VPEALDEEAIRDGFALLDSLALEEYRETLASVASDADADRSVVRVGRLVGVLLKEPFATPHPLAQPSPRTAAYRSWSLVSVDEFRAPKRSSTWQYEALDRIRSELVPEEPYLAQWSAYQFAQYAQSEVGFFGFFARAVRRYICGDKEIRQRVAEALEESSSDKKNPVVTPETIVGTGGLALGVELVHAVPVMGMVGAPVVAGLVVILYKLGVEGFCDWSAHLRTDEDEKH